MAKSVQRGKLGRGMLPKWSWPWEDWLDHLWDRDQKLKKLKKGGLFDHMDERKVQAALRRLLKPGDQAEDRRIGRLVPIKYNPRLTKPYLATTPGNIRALQRELLKCQTILYLLKPRGILSDAIKTYPGEKTAAQLKTKRGSRPTIYHRPMTKAESKRRQRGKQPISSPLLIPGRFPGETLRVDNIRVRKRKTKYRGPSGIRSE